MLMNGLFNSKKIIQPGSPGVSNFPGPEDITRIELENGIVVLTRPNNNSPSVIVHGYLPAGSISDPLDKAGLAGFTSFALMRGNTRRDFQSIYEALESVGASLAFDSGAHSTGFTGRSLSDDLDLLLEILSDSLRHPIFPAEHVERLRGQLLTGLAIRAQDTTEMASQTFDELVYEGHPYSRPEDGTPETIRVIRQADLVEFHKKHYGPQGMVLVVVGDVEPEKAVERVSRFFGDWQNPEHRLPPDLPEARPLSERARRRVIIPGKSQADVIIGSIGPTRLSPYYLAASLGNNILGQFGMYGRIGDSVRERAGLAYYSYSSLSGGIGPGPWYVTAGVDPENIERVIELVLVEISRFINEPVLEEELSDSKANYIGRLPLSLETNGGVAGALLHLERHQLGLDYYQRFTGLITEISAEDVLSAARRYLDPEKMAIAIAGPDNSTPGEPST
jgi:zinc protease